MKTTFLETGLQSKCCGCMTCINVCPKQALQIEKDAAGFLYPHINNSLCVNCGLCRSVCPQDVSLELQKPSQAFVGVNKDKSTYETSASGGAFSAIVNAWNNGNTYVVGAVMQNDFQVVHSIMHNQNGIDEIRKSKYVQSDLKNTFFDIKQLLEKKDYVVFSGTPCQVASLKSFLKKEYQQLLCVDIVCHGVPSNDMFLKYIKWLEERNTDTVIKFEFRCKDKIKGKINTRSAIAHLSSGKKLYVTQSNDPYLKIYYNRFAYRPSCYECKFACKTRVGDLTIADAWGIETINIDYVEKEGVSAIYFNSNKGKEIKENIQNNFENIIVDPELLMEKNQNMIHSTVEPRLNKAFMNRYIKSYNLLAGATKFICTSAIKKIVFYFRCIFNFNKIV